MQVSYLYNRVKGGAVVNGHSVQVWDDDWTVYSYRCFYYMGT